MKKVKEEIFVTKPDLPPLEALLPDLRKIWETKILTNRGPFHEELEFSLAKYLGVEHISLFTNGTIALVTALQALRITGEVITTPYSFVATAHSLLWNGIKPVFVDVSANGLNIDPDKIEAAITPQTTALLPVHCYGRPCELEKIQRISELYNLRVIYDASHAFGSKRDFDNIFSYGDMSVLSFHATKVFNTFEGGAIICRDAATKRRIDNLKNFGFVDEVTVVAPGINGKMSEINAVIGLGQLKSIDHHISRRREIDHRYRSALSDVREVTCINGDVISQINFSYFPILLNSENVGLRDEVYYGLKTHGVNTRRYFYPLISEFPMYRSIPSARTDNLPIATKASREILCLPIYPSLTDAAQDEIVEMLVEIIQKHGKQRT